MFGQAVSHVSSTRSLSYIKSFRTVAYTAQNRPSVVARAVALDSQESGMSNTVVPPAGTWNNITLSYQKAIDRGVAHKSETIVSHQLCSSSGVDFQIRQAETLRDKPKGPKPASKSEWKNPFLPYDDTLWVQHLSDSHTLLLNKFNLVDHHVLVVTRAFESQDHALSLADLEATNIVIQAMPSGGLAYFNHGPMSGMSQPHKHVQVVPLPLSQGAGTAVPVSILVDADLADHPIGSAVELRSFPFQSFGCSIPPGSSAAALKGMCDDLLKVAGIDEEAQLQSSYNWVMTAEWMILVPRGCEHDGPVSVNAMGYVGSFFVRSTDEIRYVQEHGCMAILQALGKPWAK